MPSDNSGLDDDSFSSPPAVSLTSSLTPSSVLLPLVSAAESLLADLLASSSPLPSTPEEKESSSGLAEGSSEGVSSRAASVHLGAGNSSVGAA